MGREVSIKQSGLWCDLCKTPILGGTYWNISINGKKGNYRSCEKCRKERVFPNLKEQPTEKEQK